MRGVVWGKKVRPWSACFGPDESLYVMNRCGGTSCRSSPRQLPSLVSDHAKDAEGISPEDGCSAEIDAIPQVGLVKRHPQGIRGVRNQCAY